MRERATGKEGWSCADTRDVAASPKEIVTITAGGDGLGNVEPYVLARGLWGEAFAEAVQAPPGRPPSRPPPRSISTASSGEIPDKLGGGAGRVRSVGRGVLTSQVGM